MTSWIILGIGFYVLVMLLIGIYANRRIHTMEDYLIAGRRLPFYLAVPTIVATWFGAGSCMGVSGTVYSQGFYGVMADPFGCALALILAGVFFAIPFRRLKLLTISDVLFKAYGESFERIATILTLPFYIGTLAANMLAMGYIFQIVLGGSLEWGIVIGTFVILLYTVAGGMWAVTITDFVQLALLMVGLLLILPICFKHTSSLSNVTQSFLQEFTTLIPTKETFDHQGSAYLGRIFMTGLGAIMGQDLVQRLMSSRTENTARFSAITAGLCYLALGLIPLFVGIAGREIMPNLDRPEQLLPLLAERYLSPLSFTIFACGLLAAIMSTADSYLLAGTSLVVNNLVLKRYPIKNERNKIKLLRWSNIVFALLALSLALSGSSIFDLMVHSGATLFVSILVPTSMALFTKKPNRAAAWSALWAGLCGWLTCILFHYHGVNHYEDLLFSSATVGAVFSLGSYIIVAIVTTLKTQSYEIVSTKIRKFWLRKIFFGAYKNTIHSE